MAPPPSHHVCDIRNETCFRCVWSRRASTTTPSSRKWERTHPPSRCSSRNWARSNTHTHGRITSISAAVTSLTCLSSQTPGPSDGPQTRESGSRLECGCALQKRRPRCFFFFFPPSTPCFVLSFSCVTHLTSCTVSSCLSLRPGLSWSAASPPSLLQEISWDEGNRAANPTSSFLWRPRPLESATSLPTGGPPPPTPSSITWSYDL